MTEGLNRKRDTKLPFAEIQLSFLECTAGHSITKNKNTFDCPPKIPYGRVHFIHYSCMTQKAILLPRILFNFADRFHIKRASKKEYDKVKKKLAYPIFVIV